MKRIIVLFFVLGTTSLFSQTNLGYGNIPYGISVESFLEEYGNDFKIAASFNNSELNLFSPLYPYFDNVFSRSTLAKENNVTTTAINNADGIMTIAFFSISDNGETRLIMVLKKFRNEYVSNDFFSSTISSLNGKIDLEPEIVEGDFYKRYGMNYTIIGKSQLAVWEKNNERIIFAFGGEYYTDGVYALKEYIYIDLNEWNNYISIYENYVEKKNIEAKNAENAKAGSNF